MKAETVRRRLRPYIGDIVDEPHIVTDTNVNKYQHLTNCIKLSVDYSEIITYLDILLKKFTPDDFNKNDYFKLGFFKEIIPYNIDDKVIKLLIKYGADINLPNNCGLTPLAIAIFNMHYADYSTTIIEKYIKNGANVNSTFYYISKMHTALSLLLRDSYYAQQRGLSVVPVAKYLLDNGATIDIDQIDKFTTNFGVITAIIEHYDKLSSKHTKLAN